MLQREFYDVQAVRDLDPSAQTSAPASERDRQLVAWLAAQLPRTAHAPWQVLELGCGEGSLSIELAAHLPAHVVGVDIAGAHVARARQRAAGSLTLSFRELDLDRELDTLESASVDVLVSVDVLEHVFDVFGFMAQVARIVRPKGLVLLRVPNVAYFRHRVALARGKLPITSSWFGPQDDLSAWRTKWGWDGGHLHYFTLPMLRSLLLNVGLRPLGFRDPGARLARLRNLAPALLAGNLAVLARRVDPDDVGQPPR